MPGDRTAQIDLGGKIFTIHAFNIGELRRISKLIMDDKVDGVERGLEIIRMALARAEPQVPVDEFETLEPTFDQVTTASDIILGLAGLKAAGNPPGEGAGAP